jgi:hypothetical protein
MNEFLIKVKELRKAQKTYFRTRNFNDLNKAKRLEKEVDEMIEKLENPQQSLNL